MISPTCSILFHIVPYCLSRCVLSTTNSSNINWLCLPEFPIWWGNVPLWLAGCSRGYPTGVVNNKAAMPASLPRSPTTERELTFKLASTSADLVGWLAKQQCAGLPFLINIWLAFPVETQLCYQIRKQVAILAKWDFSPPKAATL